MKCSLCHQHVSHDEAAANDGYSPCCNEPVTNEKALGQTTYRDEAEDDWDDED